MARWFSKVVSFAGHALNARALLTLLALATAGVLAACETAPTIARCPELRLLGDAESITRFQGDGRDITDVVLEAEFTRSRGECTVDSETIELTVVIEILARRGPASQETIGQFAYFVAVVDRDRTVLQRASLRGAVDFSGNRSRVPYIKDINISIPLPTGDRRADSYTILFGFEMTPAELEYNRRQS
ncbi:MAG: hypothetical protein QNJ84_07035 [Alphaproteobacteria bacterium]|nr:hypothetical protein [Alphaproteobacteria bacterium]